ncbi:MAG: hypothetical protein HXX08_12155 [Chloroflexi bacterium]|uniref:Nif11-like leader peptide family natural product n=1 Tax=Candidatus Chlorohelix allophototropha TaxID=3003348 RepID=A0A8T7M3P9_9CHLR|nr:hypothetical protein [Chloroflexota bacterium]WJW65994.1 Nif11-like leader peptide family natural product precursor [Chloroflexota bacterium L227-S17]
MSKVRALSYLDKMLNDPITQQKLFESDVNDIPGLVRFATRDGYAFTSNDWRSAIHAVFGIVLELDENALEQVAAGYRFSNYHTQRHIIRILSLDNYIGNFQSPAFA